MRSGLVRAKVRLLSVMGGAFVTSEKKPALEYNIVKDIRAAQTLVAKWPTPIVFSGFEIGVAIPFPHECIERGFAYVEHHPLAEAYTLYNPPPHDRPTWDLTSVLYAVRPGDGYFDLSSPGRVTVSDAGVTSFTAEPNGAHRYLILNLEEKIRVREALAELASEPPAFGRRTARSMQPGFAVKSWHPRRVSSACASSRRGQSPPIRTRRCCRGHRSRRRADE